jgi:hypothetical protein
VLRVKDSWARLQWQSTFSQEFLKAGIVPYWVEAGFDCENHHCPIPFEISLLQIVQGRFFLVEGDVNDSQVVSGDPIALRFLFQTQALDGDRKQGQKARE